MNSLLCFFGFHDWDQSRPLDLNDFFLTFPETLPPATRFCNKCQKQEIWTPGIGPDSAGVWLTNIKIDDNAGSQNPS